MNDYLPQNDESSKPCIVLDWKQDPVYQEINALEFLKTVSPQTVWDLLEQGKRHAKVMEERDGAFASLKKKQHD